MYCENPTIIVNKNLARFLRAGGRLMYINSRIGVSRPLFSIPSPKSVGATLETYEDWCVVMPDGVVHKMFILVPCNHCLLCRQKKLNEWVTRASCESSTATYPAVFVTLTYEEQYLPDDGISVKDIQKFLKRFRINWFRTFKQLLDLRYFCVGEYGRRFHRAHYHLILWNVPNRGLDDLRQLQIIIHELELAWSVRVHKKTYETLPKFLRVGKNRRKIGIVNMSPDRGNSSAYCMKYLRKDCVVPKGCNPLFKLSSRSGGALGSRYLELHKHEFSRNHGLITIPVPVDGEIKKYGLPSYFRSKIFPTLSQVLPPFIRNSIEKFHFIVKRLLSTELLSHRYDDLISMREATMCRYGRAYTEIVESATVYGKESLVCPNLSLNQLYYDAIVLYQQLYRYQPIASHLNQLYEELEKREACLEFICMNLPEVDVMAEAYSITQSSYLYATREVF